ncbi:MAG TPA: class I adenylate-forming enzyme family protein [Pseudomonadales bacterium]
MTTRAEAIATLTAPGQPYELETVPQYGVPCRAFKNAPRSLRKLYEETRSDLRFVAYEGENYTFEDIWQRSSALASALVEAFGVRKGDRVAISMRNYPEWIIAFEAATSIGAIAVAMNALWQPEEMEYGLRNCGARVLLADQERLDRLALAEPVHGLSVIAVRPDKPLAAGVQSFEDILDRFAGTAMPEADIAPEDDAIIFYTSGSTGHPKGVVSCHRSVLSSLYSWELDARCAALVAGVEPAVPETQPATLLAVPLFHATGSHAVYLMSYRQQRRLVSMYKWDVAKAAALIEAEQISSVVAPSAMTGDLVAFAAREGRPLDSLVAVGGGGAARAPEQVRRIEQTFAKALPNTGWGMTETNAIGTGIGGQDYLDHPASSGRASAVVDLRIVNEAGKELPPGQRGELQVRGISVFRGYWERPDADAESFVERWLRTGDVAYLDDEGYLYIVDRIKDLVIRGGENIGCGAVEAALLEHPLVLEASVYAVPDERLGEEVGATVYTSGPVSDDELRAFLAPHLAAFEIPRYILFSDEPLPRTASGKILKRQLREEAARHLLG